MSILCPFCLEEHERKECEIEYKETGTKKTMTIPQEYINSVIKGVPVYPITVVGYTGCGKTAFLSSFIYSLYNQIPPDWDRLCLDQRTISKIRDEYIKIMTEKGEFPPPTKDFFEEPLLVKVTFPKKGAIRQVKKNAILVMYDVKGETYNEVDYVIKNFPLISKIPNFLLLVDLFKTYKESGGAALDMLLYSLVNQLYIALIEMKANPKTKNIVICFSKTDKLRKLEGDFGQLSRKLSVSGYDFEKDSNEGIINTSKEIEKFVKEKWKNSYGIITGYFGGYLFVSSSAVGEPPVVINDKEKIEVYDPMRVIDPLLWLLTI